MGIEDGAEHFWAFWKGPKGGGWVLSADPGHPPPPCNQQQRQLPRILPGQRSRGEKIVHAAVHKKPAYSKYTGKRGRGPEQLQDQLAQLWKSSKRPQLCHQENWNLETVSNSWRGRRSNDCKNWKMSTTIQINFKRLLKLKKVNNHSDQLRPIIKAK